MFRLIITIGVFCLLNTPALAKVEVVTTTSTLKNLVEIVGKEKVNVISLTHHRQDPHFVEPKPTYMVKLRSADLLVSVGLELEIGWLGVIARGAKNPKILTGKGSFVAGHQIEAIGIQKGKVDRAQGDIHPSGNPHFHLDPVRMKKVALKLAERLSEIDHDHHDYYIANAKAFVASIDQKMVDWIGRVQASKIDRIVTFHKSFNYFLKRFGIDHGHYIEPKPGVPPTAQHLAELMKIIKSENISCILNESYYKTDAAEKIKQETGAQFFVANVEVNDNYIAHIENLVSLIESCRSGQ